MLTTILGTGVILAGVGGVAAKFGLINVNETYDIMGQKLEVVLQKDNPFKINIK